MSAYAIGVYTKGILKTEVNTTPKTQPKLSQVDGGIMTQSADGSLQKLGQLSAVHKVSYDVVENASFSPKLLKIRPIFIGTFFIRKT